MFSEQQKYDEIMLMDSKEITCGIVQHPVSQKWQTWILFHSTDIGCLTAHKSREDAINVARSIVEVWEGGLKNQAHLSAFLNKSLPFDGVPEPLPQDVVMRLVMKIQGS